MQGMRWKEDGYEGKTESGKEFSIYDDSSPSPMEMVLHAHAACSLIDVVGGLKKDVITLEKRGSISIVRSRESPRVFEKIHFVYVIRGMFKALIERIIHRSHESLCFCRDHVDSWWGKAHLGN